MEGHVLRTEIMNIFFDESGRKNDKPTTMGGLSIPQSVYSAYDFNRLTEKLHNNEMKLHWNEYSGHGPSRIAIEEAISIFTKYSKYCRMNVINYNHQTLNIRKNLQGEQDYSTLMVYTKIPERIFYGLLRNYGHDVYVKSNIFIEEATIYKQFRLPERILEQLNTQSLYRGEQYSVLSCEMYPKSKLIGIELVDLLLGIIRTIIINPTIPFGLTEKELKQNGLKKKKRKNELVIEFLKDPAFHEFLSNIQYYEWDSNKELSEVPFLEYIRLFKASNFKEFESNAPEKTEKESLTLKPPKKRKLRKSKVHIKNK